MPEGRDPSPLTYRIGADGPLRDAAKNEAARWEKRERELQAYYDKRERELRAYYDKKLEARCREYEDALRSDA